MRQSHPAIVVSHIQVQPEWLDYNQHMNVAYYTLAFDQAGEALVEAIGMGEAHTRATHNSWMVLEAHIGYLQEAHLGDELRIETRVLDCDAKRAHLYQEMYRGDDLLSAQEQLVLHVSLDTRRSAPFEAPVLARLQALQAAQAALPTPERVGRNVGIRRK